jgi:hypothetical protein
MNSNNQIIFFLGAGASVPSGLKTVVQLTDYFKEYWLKEKCHNLNYLELIEHIIQNIKKFQKDLHNISESKEGYKVDIELLLETIERLEDFDNDIISAFVNDSSLIFNEKQKQILKKKELSNEIKKFIKTTFIDDMKSIDYLNSFMLFKSFRPLRIFSTNYDLTIERFCFLKGISYTDGFDPYWNEDLFLNTDNKKLKDVNIFKLHGSVNWYRTEVGDYFSIPIQTTDMDMQLVSGYEGIPLILYPGNKLRYIEPILEILTILRENLFNTNCCFVIGYSFKDEHIAKLFKYAARINKELILFLISPSAHSIYYERLKRHIDYEFPHGYTHEGFSSQGFTTDLPSQLEGRVICLPYKTDKIFPRLKKYYESLKNGLNNEKIIYENKEPDKFFDLQTLYNLDKTKEVFSLDEFSEYTSVKTCLEYFLQCEYFERCEKIIEDCGGWDKIITEDSKFTLTMLLRFVLHYKTSSDKKYFNLLQRYLEVKKEKLVLDINFDSITMRFSISEASKSLPSADAFELFKYLLKIIHESYEISNTNNLDIEGLINNWIRIFKKWTNESMRISSYSQSYLQNGKQDLFISLLKNNDFENVKRELIELIRENEIINF